MMGPQAHWGQMESSTKAFTDPEAQDIMPLLQGRRHSRAELEVERDQENLVSCMKHLTGMV